MGKRSTDDKNLYREYFIFNYMIVVSIFSITLFLYGFFPINYSENSVATVKDIPKFIQRTRVKLDNVYSPVVKKIVIMVIDALRWDFVYGTNTSNAMLITNRLLSTTGCIYKTKVNSPTVTMPRIKTMTTGSVPSFIDVILNFGAHKIPGDNIIQQMNNYGYKTIFYGDDTWLKLFPNMFYRSEGTTSFYVNDFTEVDNNVTRNLEIELNKEDWSIMILHYLGLDHIGHISGPFSSLIKPKLQEMDKLIGKIESYVKEWNQNDQATLFLVCGDHGMKDSGGHGGASPEEIYVPLIAFGRSCTNKSNINEEISQIDIASTLSVFLGIPIPSTNLGTIILDLMNDLSLSQKLFALYYNAEQLFLRFKQIDNYLYSEAYKNYQNAIKLHSAWLGTNSHPNEMVQDIILMYETAIIEMKNVLTSNLLEYNVCMMTTAIIYLAQILYIGMSVERSTRTSCRRVFIIFIISSIAWMVLNLLFESGGKNVLYSQTIDIYFLFRTVPLFGILLLNCYLCTTHTLPIHKIKNLTKLQILLPFGTVAHALSLASSSFVEEEHQTWYFYWITLITSFAYYVLRKNAKRKSRKLCAVLLLLMISHRILRKLNSTGDKYAHLPDISGWLQEQDSNFEMTLILVFALLLLVWLDFIYEESRRKIVIFILDMSIVILVYLRHAAVDIVYKPNFNFSAEEIVNYFWIVTLIYTSYSAYRLLSIARNKKQTFISLSLFLIVKKWVIISCFLHRPYNVILLPSQLLAGAIISKLTQYEEHFSVKIYLYIWLSSVFYFYQGNSNSLATIDIAAGYVGLKSYQPFITGIFLSINTYSSHILGFLMYLYDHMLQHSLQSYKTILQLCKHYAFWRLIPISFYTIVTSIQRYHLFVWTVFSPKLLYEAMHCLVLFSVMFALQLYFILYDWLKVRKKIL